MLDRIERLAASLSPAERRVAEWVLAHPRQAVSATLAEVAQHSGSSEPTVLRFCRRLGLQGFREFGLRLTESLTRPSTYLHRDVENDDATPDAVTKVLDASIQALIDVRDSLAEMPFDDAVAELRRARQIVFAGLGASARVAEDACHKFFRLGIPCTTATDTPGILQYAAIAEARDVLIVISHGGDWSELVRASATARQLGAAVIAVTAPASKLAATADLVFGSAAEEDTSLVTPMCSRLRQLAILDAMQVALALALGPAALSRLRSTKAALQTG